MVVLRAIDRCLDSVVVWSARLCNRDVRYEALRTNDRLATQPLGPFFLQAMQHQRIWYKQRWRRLFTIALLQLCAYPLLLAGYSPVAQALLGGIGVALIAVAGMQLGMAWVAIWPPPVTVSVERFIYAAKGLIEAHLDSARALLCLAAIPGLAGLLVGVWTRSL